MTKHITKRDIHQIYNQLKNSAKRRGIEFNLKLIDLDLLSWPVTCPVLGIPLVFNSRKNCDNSYSIDRIDSSKGYTLDNIIIVSNRVNKLKSNATLDELTRIANFYANISIQ